MPKVSRKTSRAVRKYAPIVDHLARNRYGVSGAQLLADVVAGESHDNPNAVSPAGARGRTQFMPGTRQSFIKAYGIDPWRSADEAVHAAALHLTGALGHQKGLEGYNPGDPSYPKYILDQHAELSGYGRGAIGSPPAPSAYQTIPGVNNSATRQQLKLDYLQNYHNPDALLQLASGLQGAQDTPSRTVRVRSPSTGQMGGFTASGGLDFPLAKKGKLIGFPYQGTHTDFGNWQSDNAIDIATPVGTPVIAVADGRIGSQIGPLDSGNPQLAGQRVYVQGKGNQWYYAHLSRIVVKPGQRVRKGQVIGYSGAANGVAHLHIAARKGNPQHQFGRH